MVFVVIGPIAALGCLLAGTFRYFPHVISVVLGALWLLRWIAGRRSSGEPDRGAPL